MDMFPGGKPPMEDFISSWYPLLIALTCGLLFGLRSYMKGCPNPCQDRMEGKTVVITGGTSGMGKELAQEMVTRGANVIITCRTIEAGKAAVDSILEATQNENKRIRAILLDLANLKTLQEFVRTFKKDEDKLYLLVNNAGVMGHPREMTPEDNDYSLQVNYLGHFLLTHLLLDNLIAAGNSRIINVTCHAHRIATMNLDDLNMEKVTDTDYKPGEMYAQAKAAVVMFTRQMARYLEGTKVTCNVMSPGVVRSLLYRNVPLMNGFFYYSFFPLIWLLMKTAKDGIQTTLYCSLSKDEESVSGKLYSECKITDFEGIAADDTLAARLWDESFRLVGLKPIKTLKKE